MNERSNMKKYNKVAIYCRIGHERVEDIKEEDKPFIDIDKYIPYKGFHDLREFDISRKNFRKLWKIQDALYSESKNKDYLKKRDPVRWNNLKNLSAEYQKILLSNKFKQKEFEDIEMER